MRPVVLVLAMTAACSSGGDGAVLTFDVPAGLVAASRIDLVLASDDAPIEEVFPQRKRTGTLDKEDVVYFRQRTAVDSIVGITSLFGFEVRIEPDVALVPDTTFIPFALIYNAQDVLVGVGSVNNDKGTPSAVIIKPGLQLSYTVTVTALEPDLDRHAELSPGDGYMVDCEGNLGPWRSGAVWRAASGPQIRLLLPDPEATDATDAMERPHDLDCDQSPAIPTMPGEDLANVPVHDRDCDDLRAAYNPEQIETCDGNDTDCDEKRLELIQGCQVTNFACSMPGVLVCDDLTPTHTPTQSVCAPTADCACRGTLSPDCTRCDLAFTASSFGKTPCQPSVGKLYFAPPSGTVGCTLNIVNIEGPWALTIAPERDGNYVSQLTGITSNSYWLQALYSGSAPLSLAPPLSIGAGYIMIRCPMAAPQLKIVDLGLMTSPGNSCDTSGGNLSIMDCQGG